MKNLTVFILLLCCYGTFAQPITGVWKGRLGRQRVEVKMVQNGDNITGTSYYYSSANNYRRYSIKGRFDPDNNSIVWWDDALIDENSGNNLQSSSAALMRTTADFNCPGGDKMLLEGTTHPRDKEDNTDPVLLEKIQGQPTFPDEWDYVIDNFTIGTNDPNVIDSVELIAKKAAPKKKEKKVVEEPAVVKTIPKGMVAIPPKPAPVIIPNQDSIATVAIAEKFTTRTKVFVTDVPLEGDSIELRFYDNAEIDGDSISLFLNDKLIYQHIRLAGSAYKIKLAVQELNDNNELVMVAENLGTIPPNTSYMIAEVGGKRYEARLASTENSSAYIRLTKAALAATPTQQ